MALCLCAGGSAAPQDATAPAAPAQAAPAAPAAARFPSAEQAAAKGAIPLSLERAEALRHFIGPDNRPHAADEAPLPAGLVALKILVDQVGVVQGVTPVKTTSLALVQPAVEWAQKWRFRSYDLYGRSSRFTVVLIARFDRDGKTRVE
jgi:outer membrane biosynthesis protein TonB